MPHKQACGQYVQECKMEVIRQVVAGLPVSAVVKDADQSYHGSALASPTIGIYISYLIVTGGISIAVDTGIKSRKGVGNGSLATAVPK